MPYGVAITPDRTKAYVANHYDGTVTPITIATNTAGTPITVGTGGDVARTDWVAITPDASKVYAANYGSNSIVPITVSTDTAGAAITGVTSPNAVAITPDGATAYIAEGTAGSPSSFDASASTVAYGTITSYAWNFGDGNSATTSTPTTTHGYPTAGTYTATLTETDSAGTSTTQVFSGQTISRNRGPSGQTTRTVPVTPRRR